VDDLNGVPQSVGTLLRRLEDARTSTIFERLTYLTPSSCWKLLRLGSNNAIPDFRLIELAEVVFWPKWQIARSGRRLVEPDIYMRWIVGDPSIIVDMIVEAKLPGPISQSPRQWLEQLEAYRDNFCMPDEPNSDDGGLVDSSEFANALIHMSVDGLGSKPNLQISQLAPANIPEGLPDTRFVGCSWQTLSDSLDNMDRSGELDTVPRPLVEDLRKTFDYCGHQPFRVSDGLFHLDTKIAYESTMSGLSDWSMLS
tara:strand:- start:2439 stop:3200 length:762 start_codon:yes stop_codon:yes gene_type:complete